MAKGIVVVKGTRRAGPAPTDVRVECACGTVRYVHRSAVPEIYVCGHCLAKARPREGGVSGRRYFTKG